MLQQLREIGIFFEVARNGKVRVSMPFPPKDVHLKALEVLTTKANEILNELNDGVEEWQNYIKAVHPDKAANWLGEECEICRHQNRADIEQLYNAGVSPERIGKLYNVSPSSIYLHHLRRH